MLELSIHTLLSAACPSETYEDHSVFIIDVHCVRFTVKARADSIIKGHRDEYLYSQFIVLSYTIESI